MRRDVLYSPAAFVFIAPPSSRNVSGQASNIPALSVFGIMESIMAPMLDFVPKYASSLYVEPSK